MCEMYAGIFSLRYSLFYTYYECESSYVMRMSEFEIQ